MSESERPDLDEHRTTAGVDSKYADVASDDHALKERFGADEQAKKIEFEAEIIGERVAQWYDDPAAAIREYLSNAETACIRRATQELEDGGYEVPDSVRERLEKAREKCGYAAVIEVTHNKDPNSTRFVIEDNGIGISTDEYLVLKKIGYSTSHMDGERLGQFGMGYLSGFQLSGTQGVFNMRTRSFLTEETYSTANYITNFEYLDGLKENYGTRFEFPSFCEKAQSIDIRNKVEHFAEGMRVSVLYREMDTSGQETFNEDYMPTSLTDDYDDDALLIHYENEFFEAVMSPSSPNRQGYVTYNISMPIRRNNSKYGTEPKFKARWTWDFRGKSENGPIVSCDSDESVVGLSPVSDSKYEGLPDDRKDSFIRRSNVPDDAITMPTPASSRDSYESGHDGFWRYVSKKLQEKWSTIVADELQSLNSFDDFASLDRDEKLVIVRGYDDFGPGYGKNDADTIIDTLESEIGVTVSTDMATMLDRLTNTERIVTHRAANPQHKSSTTKKKVWEIIDESGDATVYVGKTISPKKADIAWSLNDDNIIVRAEPKNGETTKECYERLQNMWGWELLKELPSRNLKEELPELPDDVAEKYENKTDKEMKQQSSGGSSNRRTSRNPETKVIKVYGSKKRSHRGLSRFEAETVYDNLDGGEKIRAGHNNVRKLLVYYEGNVSTKEVKKHTEHTNVGVATVPKYVYDYLKGADNVYTSIDDLEAAQRKDATVEIGGIEERLDQLGSSDLLICDDQLKKRFSDKLDALREEISQIMDEDFDRATFVKKGRLVQYWAVDTDATVVSTQRVYGVGSERLVDDKRLSAADMLKRIEGLDDIDWNHSVMKKMNSYGRLKTNEDALMEVAEYLRENDCLPTKDT